MSGDIRPFRSVLYIPCSRERAIEKARTLAADALIFDLEDAVSPNEKDRARTNLIAALSHGEFRAGTKIVRINDLKTIWVEADIAAVNKMNIDAVLLPKVGSASDITTLASALARMPLWAMMETPLAILNAQQIASHSHLRGMVMGTNDLQKELRAKDLPARLALHTSLQLCILAARAHGKTIVDGVYNAFKNTEGLHTECVQGRDFGMDGKTLIHPAQIAVANEVFAPSADEIALALRHIEAHEAADAAGEGVAVVDDRIVESLHVATARSVLARAKVIAAMAAEDGQ
ncbi:MAG: CoA ester lyase [Aestuariivita sp.]|nr:CoA ester lyase [Aestuariivita sp.]MCY4345487.1 CoA ester lyase [Aestuariivita sp.]